jgi:hypothetical protein
MAAVAEPGWYDDGTGAMRWWDGSRWTEHYADFGFGVELRTGPAPASSPTAAGWYDDGRGRMRWWDGRRWTAQSRFSGGEQSYAGVVVDGRWIHLGELSQPIAGVVAVVDSLERIGKRPGFSRAAHAKALFDPTRASPESSISRSCTIRSRSVDIIRCAAGPMLAATAVRSARGLRLR